MREIKFRAWDDCRKKMIHEFTEKGWGKKYRLLNDEGRLFCGNYQDNGDWNEPVLMQFTGLRDKNKVEIYEGDVIKWRFVNTGEDEPEYTEPVEWSDCGFFLDGGAPLTVAMDDCEVIGNIYQHPELLKP